MRFECGKCDNIFDVSGIKESVVTCSKCGSKNSIRELKEINIVEGVHDDRVFDLYGAVDVFLQDVALMTEEITYADLMRKFSAVEISKLRGLRKRWIKAIENTDELDETVLSIAREAAAIVRAE